MKIISSIFAIWAFAFEAGIFDWDKLCTQEVDKYKKEIISCIDFSLYDEIDNLEKIISWISWGFTISRIGYNLVIKWIKKTESRKIIASVKKILAFNGFYRGDSIFWVDSDRFDTWFVEAIKSYQNSEFNCKENCNWIIWPNTISKIIESNNGSIFSWNTKGILEEAWKEIIFSGVEKMTDYIPGKKWAALDVVQKYI